MEVVEEDIGLGQLFGLLVLVVKVWVPRNMCEQHLVGGCMVCKDVLELKDCVALERWV